MKFPFLTQPGQTYANMNAVTNLFKSNRFFLSLTGFASVLPFSYALVSIMAGVMLFAALTEDTWKNKFNRAKNRKYLLTLPAIFVVYLISAILCFKNGNPVYDLRKTLFFVIIPLAFLIGKPINRKQFQFLFLIFGLAVFIASLYALGNWALSPGSNGFKVHEMSLISHIRFSFQLILIFWFLVMIIYGNIMTLNRKLIFLAGGMAAYFLLFLIFQQSLTGLLAFGASLLFFLIYWIINTSSRFKWGYATLAITLFAGPVIYVAFVVYKFYNIEQIDKNTIEWKTPSGNDYVHDFNNPLVENGKYVYLFVCEKELREQWNKRSEYKYDSIGINGYPVYATLIRYLTSKGLHKDAGGVQSLDPADIQNIENGMANVIFQDKNFSIYPRIYQTIWEFYVYTKTGDANFQSLSQRIEFARAALLIIEENPWLGVGAGNWKEEFQNTFVKMNSKLDKSLYASAHNQYLNYLVKFGILGFLIVMLCLFYPALKTGKFRDPLFLLFFIYLFFANFADSNFESHMGSSFFLFFYCIFLVSGNKEYLVKS